MKRLLSIAICAFLLAGCVNCYTRCPLTDPRVESVYQSSKSAAGASMLVAFPQVMACAPSKGISWVNVCTIPLGLLGLCDAVVEAAIDTVCLPVDIPLANMRDGDE